jgi:hypothetical protein
MNVQALAEFLSESAQRPAKLGSFDCVSFAFEGVKIGWDRDYLDCLGYQDRRSAIDRLRAADGLYDAICEGLGQDLPICELDPGDLAWLPPSLIGLIMPGYIAVKCYRTVLRVPLEQARSGWKTDGLPR